jgi:hypothetical protein
MNALHSPRFHRFDYSARRPNRSGTRFSRADTYQRGNRMLSERLSIGSISTLEQLQERENGSRPVRARAISGRAEL